MSSVEELKVYHNYRLYLSFFVPLNHSRDDSERSFKIPSRITFNDARKQAWFADLANPDVPLYKLGKNIPHGVRGHDLLELLHSMQVSIPRAVWFIRVFGSNETVRLVKLSDVLV